MHQKQIKYLLLFSFFFLFISTNNVLANESVGKGKLQIRTNLIHDKGSNSESLYETELDKVFPELFTEETASQFNLVQEKQQKNMKNIRHDIFTTNIQTNSLYHVKDKLFTEEYETSLRNEQAEDAKTTDIVSLVLFYGSVAMLISIIVGVSFFIGKKLNF